VLDTACQGLGVVHRFSESGESGEVKGAPRRPRAIVVFSGYGQKNSTYLVFLWRREGGFLMYLDALSRAAPDALWHAASFAFSLSRL